MTKSIKIETIMGCNASCSFCPLGAGILKRKRGRMDSEFFFNTVDQARNLGFEITPYFMNEPLMEPRIFEFFDYIKTTGGKQRIFTNASLITKKVAEQLSQYQYLDFVISFHGGNKKDYERVTGLNFEATVSNIKYLVSLGGIPNYLISMKISEENKNSVDDFRNLWKGYKFQIGKTVNWAGTFGKGRGAGKCALLNMPCVFWDGRIPLCCRDAEGRVITGDLRKQSLKEILNGEIYQKYIDFSKKGKLNQLYPCSVCN